MNYFDYQIIMNREFLKNSWIINVQRSEKSLLSFHLELEIDKRLQISGDELIDDKHNQCNDENHERNRHLGEPNAIAALEIIGQPVDDHTNDDEAEHIAVVVGNIRDDLQIPVATNLIDHVFGRVPSRFVGFGWVEVRT